MARPGNQCGRRGCDIAIVISYSGDGGVERMVNHLIRGLLDAGQRVDVVVLKRGGGHFAGLPTGARVHRCVAGHWALALPELVWYLRRRRPPVLLAAKYRAGLLAVHATALARVSTRVFLRVGNTITDAFAGRGRLRRWLRYRPMQRAYPRAAGIVAVSQGVAEDVIATAGVDPAHVHVAPNPVLPWLPAGVRAPNHPWFGDDGPPIVLGVGRMVEQKDLATLIRAFARLRGKRDARLVILGDGEQRARLEHLVRELGLTGVVDMPGFVDEVDAYLAHSDLFALSSRWEGSPNVLVEAMAHGTPVVATDCRSGPREILADGEHGRLVPVGDVEGLAAAMAAALAAPRDPAALRRAAAAYSVENSTARYMQVLGLVEGARAPSRDDDAAGSDTQS